MKRIAAIVFSLLLLVAALFFWPRSSPPPESKLIANFHAHRAAFERMREMLKADSQLRRVASWGVETTTSGIHKPPEGDFPVARYNEYLMLLRVVGAKGASQGERGDQACILMWASGWAGDTRHSEVCWMGLTPDNQVSSLDDFYRSPKPRSPVFRRVDGDWYLWADW